MSAPIPFQVIINYWLLPIALVLLWLPRQWLRFGGRVFAEPRRRRVDHDEHDQRDVSLKYREEFTKSRNWIDFLRAIAGSLAISYCCFENGAVDKAVDARIFVLQCVVLIAAVLIQTIRHEGRFSLVAPVFFILGLSFGLIGWKGGLFASITIWTLNLVLPSAGVFLFVFAGIEICFGLLLSKVPLRFALLAAALAILPVLLSAVTKHRLVRFSKKTKHVRV